MNTIIRTITLTIPAQQAKMSGSIGPLLGQYSLNIMKFCKEFNEKSKNLDNNLPVKVHLQIFKNNDFNIIIKNPSTNFLLKYYSTNNEITITNLYKIALIKQDEYPKQYFISEFKCIVSIAFQRKFKIIYT